MSSVTCICTGLHIHVMIQKHTHKHKIITIYKCTHEDTETYKKGHTKA